MYKRSVKGLAQQFDFIVLDELSLQLAFFLAVAYRHHFWAFVSPRYRGLGCLLLLLDALLLIPNGSLHQVMTRGCYAEAAAILKHCFSIFAVTAIYMFSTQSGDVFSRIVLFVTFLLYLVIGYSLRLLWKAVVKKYRAGRHKDRSMLLVTSLESADETLRQLTEDGMAAFQITGIILTEKSGRSTLGVYPVVADLEDAADYIEKEWVDSVYIDAPLSNEKVVKLMDDCSQMGVPTHYHVPNMSRGGVKRFLEPIGGTMVLTTSINYATPGQALLKRSFDIVAGLIGSLAAVLIIAIVGPIIKRESPGPILFSQERIGKNGKRFKIYKIRSMYLDAEERKKDLMDQNRVKDGMMFKLDFDPRIIGNRILPDGTRKTGIGEFIRKTSLDEFPQFFLVSKGVMSTIGTRPPTVDEYARYQYHHRARMAIKPGITGLWQVSGRSEITDFEEVVRLDTEYITNWSPELDLKILFKTFGVLFSHKGAL